VVKQLIVTMGMPGSGKSHWCNDNVAQLGAVLVSSDPVRTDGRDPRRWFMGMRDEVDLLLADGASVVVDACNVTPQQRRSWLRIGRLHDARCVLVVINTPARLALDRNAVRPIGEQVPVDRMHRYASQFAASKVVAAREPWDETLVVTDFAPVPEPERVKLDTSRAW